MSKKLNRLDYIFQNKKNETLIKQPGNVNGLDFVIMNLEDCDVYLMDHSAQIFVDDCINCRIHIGPVSGSLFVRTCKNLKVSASCAQYRVSDSNDIDSCVFSQTEPAIEACHGLRFGPYNFAYPLQDQHFQKADLDPTKNKWSQVHDFNEDSTNPHWKILPPEDFPGPINRTIEGLDAPVNPVPLHKQYGGDLDAPIIVGSQANKETIDEGGMMAFDIKTGQTQAQEVFEAHIQDETHKQDDDYADIFWSDHPPQQNQAGANVTDNVQFNQKQPQSAGFDAHLLDGSNQPEQKNVPMDLFDQNPSGFYPPFGQQQQNPQFLYEQKQDIFTNDSNKFNQSQTNAMTRDLPGFESEDPEELARTARLKGNFEEKMIEEDKKKREKREKAKKILNEMKEDYERACIKRMELNRQNEAQQRKNKVENYNSPWDKIIANIDIKEADYKGSRDITRFRQALLNKKADLSGQI